MTENSHGVVIREAYKDFTPSVPAYSIVKRMLSYVPAKYLGGLQTIILTNAASLNHKRRRHKTWSRKKKGLIREARGLYHEPWNGEPAWIELFVDNIVASMLPAMRWLPPARDLDFAEVLFHEIGHHIHKTKIPIYREQENVADDWAKRLSRRYYRRRYWYLLPLVSIINILLIPFKGKIKTIQKECQR